MTLIITGVSRVPENEPVSKCLPLNRREFLGCGAGVLLSVGSSKVRAALPSLPTAPVGIARCRRYDYELIRQSLAELFDQIGGVKPLVQGKTVTVKINLTGNWNVPIYTLSPQETVYTHPLVTLAAVSLFHEYGARRIQICESCYSTAEARAIFDSCGYDVSLFESMVPTVTWEDTRYLGSGENYREVSVGDNPAIFRKFYLNHRYVDTDVMVSIAKMKNHDIAGITLAMKNLFGITPSALYAAPVQNEHSTSARMAVLHEGQPSAAGGEVLPALSREPGVRVPNIIVDILKARPVDLSIIDGVVSMHGGEGAWMGSRLGLTVPGLLMAGRNAVCTDSVGAAVMGYNPEVDDHEKPFYAGANMLRLGAERGVGTNRLGEIEVVGLPISEARYDFQPSFKSRGDD